MYRMSSSEFMQYESAKRRLQELRIQHVYELQRAYDGIHPTQSCFNYDEGSIHSESINPADYAIYLIELKDEHQRQQRWWRLRSEAYEEAFQKLTEEERMVLYGSGTYGQKEAARNKLKEVLITIVETRHDLKRQSIPYDDFEDMEEADRQIEKMSVKELLKDYQDFVDPEQEERLKKQCIYLYQACDWPYSMIGKRLGIPTSRVKRYVNLGEDVTHKAIKPLSTSNCVSEESNVEITYLNPGELKEYRSGKKGGSKWCSYDDYCRMKEKGMSLKEIAANLGITPSALSKRVKYWKSFKENRNDAAII